MPINLTAAADDDDRRLDRILRKALPDMPLSAIHRLLRKGGVRVDGEKAAIDFRVKAGQTITINLKDISQRREGASNLWFAGFTEFTNHARNFASRIVGPSTRDSMRLGERKFGINKLADIILFEGAGLLVLNKPAGLAVHGRESLEEMVRSYLEPKLPPSLSFKPGPLHRLDRPSSGVIAFSTSLEGARFFSAMMRNRMIKKRYLALVSGVIEKDEVWEDELVRDGRQKKTFRSGDAIHGVVINDVSKPGGAKTALTRVSPLAGDGERTLILAEIETGRTHQIRAQAAGRGHPLAGDKKYNAMYGDAMHGDAIHGDASDSCEDFLLHAWRMEFLDKSGEKTDNKLYEGLPGGLPSRIEAPLPEKFLEKIRNIFGKGIITDLLSEL